MPLGYWPVSRSQRTVRPVFVVVAEISLMPQRTTTMRFMDWCVAAAMSGDERWLGRLGRRGAPPREHRLRLRPAHLWLSKTGAIWPERGERSILISRPGNADQGETEATIQDPRQSDSRPVRLPSHQPLRAEHQRPFGVLEMMEISGSEYRHEDALPVFRRHRDHRPREGADVGRQRDAGPTSTHPKPAAQGMSRPAVRLGYDQEISFYGSSAQYLARRLGPS